MNRIRCLGLTLTGAVLVSPAVFGQSDLGDTQNPTLKTYQGNPIHALEQALALVSTLEDAAGAAPSLPPSPERQPPEAKPFLVRLKYLRDLARLDLRPFYFFDDQNKIQRIGASRPMIEIITERAHGANLVCRLTRRVGL